ncbi:hypothetical protein LPB41_01585 [Thalassospira sp. MA62]|nr:hypothetical protein [Thalassospira sp. MA62]
MVGTNAPSGPATNSPSTQNTSSDNGLKTDREAPAQDDVKRFNDSLERRERDQQGKGDQQSGDGDRGGDGRQSRGDEKSTGTPQGDAQSPMQLFGKQNQTQSAGPVQSLAPTGADNRLNELAQNLTSRILVGENSGATEVRIQLNDAVLPGTEVRISERDGRLIAEFISSNADSTNFLNQRQDDLAARLSKVLQKDVDVITIKDSGTGTNDGDSNRRSSQEYQGDEEDADEDDRL